MGEKKTETFIEENQSEPKGENTIGLGGSGEYPVETGSFTRIVGPSISM